MRDSDKEYVEYQETIKQDFGDNKMNNKYLWFFRAEYCADRSITGSLTMHCECDYILTYTDDYNTVGKQICRNLGEGFRIVSLDLRSDNVIVVNNHKEL